MTRRTFFILAAIMAWFGKDGTSQTIVSMSHVVCQITVGQNFIENETPGGLINGANRAFTLLHPPNPATSLGLYRNGLRQKAGLDYALTGNTIMFTFNSRPHSGDTLIADYRY